MAYQHTYLKSSITIRSVVSIHYFEYMSDFHFPGECHDFWELVCVDKGEIQAAAGDKMVTLKRGSILFHQPGEFHSVIANGRVSPSLVVISFDCRSRAMNQFAGQILTVRETEASLLSRIIIEARNAFQGRLNDPYQEELNRRMLPQAFGAEQLIKNYLEELLICLYRRYWPLIPGAGSIPRGGSSLSLPSVPDTGLGQISLKRSFVSVSSVIWKSTFRSPLLFSRSAGIILLAVLSSPGCFTAFTTAALLIILSG